MSLIFCYILLIGSACYPSLQGEISKLVPKTLVRRADVECGQPLMERRKPLSTTSLFVFWKRGRREKRGRKGERGAFPALRVSVHGPQPLQGLMLEET